MTWSNMCSSMKLKTEADTETKSPKSKSVTKMAKPQSTEKPSKPSMPKVNLDDKKTVPDLPDDEKLTKIQKRIQKKLQARQRKKLKKLQKTQEKKMGVKLQKKKPDNSSSVNTTKQPGPKLHKGHAVKFHGKFSKQVLRVYTEEKNYIENLFKRVPKPERNEENLDEYLLESDDSEVELKAAPVIKPKKSKKRKRADAENGSAEDDEEGEKVDTNKTADDEDDDDDDVDKEEEKRRKFLESLAELKSKKAKVEPEPSREELKARLEAKLEEIRKSKERTSLKPKKKKKKKDRESDDKKKQFISKPNPNVHSKSSGKTVPSIPSVSVKDETNSISSNASSSTMEHKTPLRKNKVVKSNGQIVYSKFDFISDDKYYKTTQYSDKKSAPKPAQLLKKVEKMEEKVSKLESSGKTSEALALTNQAKWNTALKRAQGEKVRDDPTLLKKTIKKEHKMKEVKRKKWKERTDHVEKQKQKLHDKRQANIQARKDEKKKRSMKLQRKRGRIA